MRTTLGVATAALMAGIACAFPASEQRSGEIVYRQCIACHELETGRNTPAGPNLQNVVGRAIAAEPGFNYSPAMRRFASENDQWSTELLDRFIADPEAVVPGTEMGYIGLRDPEQRRVLLNWLAAGRSGRD